MSRTACFLAIFIATDALACRPVPGFTSPTLSENIQSASSVFLGRVVQKSKLGKSENKVSDHYALEFEVRKSWKGPLLKKINAYTESDTCNPFGQFTGVGEICIILLNSKNEIVSGLFAGDSSICVPKDSPRAATLESEFDAKFKKSTR